MNIDVREALDATMEAKEECCCGHNVANARPVVYNYGGLAADAQTHRRRECVADIIRQLRGVLEHNSSLAPDVVLVAYERLIDNLNDLIDVEAANYGRR